MIDAIDAFEERAKFLCNIGMRELSGKTYENGSIIMNSNKNLSSWGEALGDAVMATAMLDRLLHHCTVINIRRGETYRLRERLSIPFKNSSQSQGETTAGTVGTKLRNWWEFCSGLLKTKSRDNNSSAGQYPGHGKSGVMGQFRPAFWVKNTLALTQHINQFFFMDLSSIKFMDINDCVISRVKMKNRLIKLRNLWFFFQFQTDAMNHIVCEQF